MVDFRLSLELLNHRIDVVLHARPLLLVHPQLHEEALEDIRIGLQVFVGEHEFHESLELALLDDPVLVRVEDFRKLLAVTKGDGQRMLIDHLVDHREQLIRRECSISICVDSVKHSGACPMEIVGVHQFRNPVWQ